MKRKRLFHSAPYILCLALLILPSSDSFASPDGSIKSVRIDAGQAGSYSVWQKGAIMQLTPAEDGTHDGNTALRIDLAGPNGATGEKSGSFYHILPEHKRNWSQTELVRFWIKNTSGQSLLLNFSFKEAASEDWGLADSGIFFLEDADGTFCKTEYSYSNLEIPARYEGYVVIPFSSLTVPDWSTATGDRELALSNIETYAFGAQYTGSPQTFCLDDITVTALPDSRSVCVQLPSAAVKIPKGTPSYMLISAYVTDLKGALADEDVSFWLEKDYPGISLSANGMLTVSTEANPADVQIKAAVAGRPQYYHTFTVHVVRDITAPLPSASAQAGVTAAADEIPPETDRQKSSEQIAVLAAAAVTILILFAAILTVKFKKKRNN